MTSGEKTLDHDPYFPVFGLVFVAQELATETAYRAGARMMLDLLTKA